MALSTHLFVVIFCQLFLSIASGKFQRNHYEQSGKSQSHDRFHLPGSSSHHLHKESHGSHSNSHGFDSSSHELHTHSHSHHQSLSSSKLMSLLSKSPVVMIVNSESFTPAKDSHDEASHEDLSYLRAGVTKILSEKPKDEEVYKLYTALRSAPDNISLDDKTKYKLESAKQVLKQKLVARCGQKKQCKSACKEVKKPSKCQSSCNQKFDEEDACSSDPEPESGSDSDSDQYTRPPCYDDCSDSEDTCDTCKSCQSRGCGQKKGRTMSPHWLRSMLGI